MRVPTPLNENHNFPEKVSKGLLPTTAVSNHSHIFLNNQQNSNIEQTFLTFQFSQFRSHNLFSLLWATDLKAEEMVPTWGGW